MLFLASEVRCQTCGPEPQYGNPLGTPLRAMSSEAYNQEGATHDSTGYDALKIQYEMNASLKR